MQACPGLGPPVSLRRLLPAAEFRGADDVSVSGCSCDPRRVGRGHLFAALPGRRRDGRDSIGQVVARGCAAVLVEQPLPELALPVCIVPDARDAYGRICQALAGDPSRRLKVIGIGGTAGKTTTSCLLASILTTAGYRVGMTGSLGYLDGRRIEQATLSTPSAETLAAWLARMVRNECSHAVIEVSDHALDHARVAGIRMDAACLTNVGDDHLDCHQTRLDHHRAKSRLFDCLSVEGFAVVNVDDPLAADCLGQINGPALTVGIRSPAEITAVPLEQWLNEQTFLLCAGNETIPVRTEMIGTHHIANCLVAAAVGLTYGIDLATVVRGLETAGQVPGRLERIECGQPFGVFVDFARTPHAVAGCLRTLRALTAGRLICVFGAGDDRRKRPLMGRAVETAADLAVVTSGSLPVEDPETAIREVLCGMRRADAAEVVADRAEAIRRALAAAEPGDCVLIAGNGHQNHRIIAEDCIPPDDRQLAKQWLHEVQPYAELTAGTSRDALRPGYYPPPS